MVMLLLTSIEDWLDLDIVIDSLQLIIVNHGIHFQTQRYHFRSILLEQRLIKLPIVYFHYINDNFEDKLLLYIKVYQTQRIMLSYSFIHILALKYFDHGLDRRYDWNKLIDFLLALRVTFDPAVSHTRGSVPHIAAEEAEHSLNELHAVGLHVEHAQVKHIQIVSAQFINPDK